MQLESSEAWYLLHLELEYQKSDAMCVRLSKTMQSLLWPFSRFIFPCDLDLVHVVFQSTKGSDHRYTHA